MLKTARRFCVIVGADIIRPRAAGCRPYEEFLQGVYNRLYSGYRFVVAQNLHHRVQIGRVGLAGHSLTDKGGYIGNRAGECIGISLVCLHVGGKAHFLGDGLHFFKPIQGVITEPFNLSINHPYIDVAAPKGSIIYSILDGTVISADWNDQTGYTIQIQHDNNLISIYKHAERVLKSTGDKIEAGTPIAIVGNTGKLSTGEHLHFELWHGGEAIDPTHYINF